MKSCFSRGADMIKVSSTEENQFFQQSARGKNWWLGLQRDEANNNIFKWNDGSIVDSVFTRWSQGEPNNHGNDEKCVEYSYLNGLWNDVKCDQERGLACEKGKHCTNLFLAPCLLICRNKKNKDLINKMFIHRLGG